MQLTCCSLQQLAAKENVFQQTINRLKLTLIRFLIKFSKAMRAGMVKYHEDLACLLQLTAAFCTLTAACCSLLQRWNIPSRNMLQSSNWDHSVHHVHYIVVSILFLIKFSKTLGQLGHCCKPEKLQQLIAAVRALKKVKFPEQASIHKIKAAITEIITFKSSSALHFSSNSQTTGTCCN